MLLFQYGTSDFPAAFALDRPGPASNERIPFAWYFYALDLGERVVLIDTGFVDEKRARLFGLRDLRAPLDLLARAGIAPGRVSDVLLTHGHFDHADHFDRFGRARVWSRQTGRSVLGSRHGPAGGRSRFEALRNAGRLVELPARAGPPTRVLEASGWRVELLFAGGHTPDSQAVLLAGPERSYLISGDECYLARPCLAGRGLPARSAFSAPANRRFLLYIKKETARGTELLTLHDPEIASGARPLFPGVFQIGALSPDER